AHVRAEVAGQGRVDRPDLPFQRGNPGRRRGVGRSRDRWGRASAAGQQQGQRGQERGAETGGQGHAGGETVGRGGASTNTPASVMAAAIRRRARSPAAVPVPRTQAAITTRAGRGRTGGSAGCMAIPRSQVRRYWVPVLWAKAT